jgi:hypothetical protein
MLDATQNAVYIAENNPTKQFQIIDTHDKANPIIQGTYSLPGVAGSFPGASSIFYYNNKVYVGTHRTAGRELHVYDVSTNPARWLGSLELNHNINAIAVREPYVYLATSGNTKDMIVVDATNPASMKMISSLDIPGPEDSLTLFMEGTTMYLGRKKSTSSVGNPELVAIDVSNPLVPIIATSTLYKKDVTGIRVINSHFFISFQNMFNDTYVDSDFEGNSMFTLTEKALHITTPNP